MKLIDDILKTNKDGERRFSQSRVYLFITLTIMLTLLTLQCGDTELSLERTELITNNLFYLILIFSGYALGEKGIANLDKIISSKK